MDKAIGFCATFSFSSSGSHIGTSGLSNWKRPAPRLAPFLGHPLFWRSNSRQCRRSGIAVMQPDGARRHGGWGVFGGPPSSSTRSRIMTSLRPTVSVSDGDLKTDDKMPPLPEKRVLAGVGTVTLDFLACVASFPDPDAKIRSHNSVSDLCMNAMHYQTRNLLLKVEQYHEEQNPEGCFHGQCKAQGGGNVGNALTGAARLGLSPRIFSKLASDASGIGILEEFKANGVDVSHIVVAEDGVSPFTYVIVDDETKTRTCIHTPGYPPLEPEELSPQAIGPFLDGVDLLYLDGRLPDATVLIAEEAKSRQLPILIDAERKRERLDEMLPLADYLVTSAKFPQVWTEAPTLAGALIALALQLPQLKFIIVTQGSAGCVMLEKSSLESREHLDANATLLSLQEEAKRHQGSEPVVFSSKVGVLRISNGKSTTSDVVAGRLRVGTAAFLSPGEVVDTTGAGDAFIGGIAYGILAGFPPEKMLPLGATVAAAKCQALGARTGLPHRNDARVVPLL